MYSTKDAAIIQDIIRERLSDPKVVAKLTERLKQENLRPGEKLPPEKMIQLMNELKLLDGELIRDGGLKERTNEVTLR